MMTLAEGGVADALEVVKVLATSGSAGVLVWVLHWLFTKELPRRDAAVEKITTAYEGRIEDLRKQAEAAQERYAADLKGIAASNAVELQRIRDADLAERRAERAETARLFREHSKVTEDLIRKVQEIPPAKRGG